MTLFLVGYMGSGKSIVGKTLAEILGFSFIDFDTYIETKEDASIDEIFKSKGEIYFRKAEFRYLEDLFVLDQTVIALGGGTPCYGTTMNRILKTEHSACIYLKTSVMTLTGRLFKERSKRPLIAHLNSKEALDEFIGKHLFERAPFYEQSDFSIKTDHKMVRDIAEEIVLKLF